MKKEILLFLLIVLCPVAFADGIPINPYDYHLAEMNQESQIAYIDFDGEKSTVSLFVSFDFAGYDKEEMIWIVPFKDIPDNVDLEETTFYEFEQKFSEFDEGIEHATNLKRAYESDIPMAFGFATTLYYFPVFALLSLFIVSTPTGMAGEPMPEKSFDFGSLGRADVYKISDKVTLQQFFQEKGVQAPSNLGSFLDKHIVVFSINKTKEKIRTLARFDFSNRSELFYPSSTTALWEGTPENYIIKVRAPLHYKLSPNIKPNLEINDLQYQYMIFSPSCTGLSGHLTGYGLYGYEFDAEGFRQVASTNPELEYLLELYDTDLEIEVKEERKALPLGMYVASIANPWLLALLFIFISWIAATYAYSRLKKKYTSKEILQIGITGFFIWMALNIIFTVLFLIILLAVIFPIYTISMASISGGGYALYSFLMLLLPIIFIADLAVVLFVFKMTVVDRFDKIFVFPKGKVRFRDFIAILLSAFIINLLLIAIALVVFQIPL
jgi:hypothetical protein